MSSGPFDTTPPADAAPAIVIPRWFWRLNACTLPVVATWCAWVTVTLVAIKTRVDDLPEARQHVATIQRRLETHLADPACGAARIDSIEKTVDRLHERAIDGASIDPQHRCQTLARD